MDEMNAVLDGLDEGRLAEIQLWWESDDVELAADAIQEVSQAADCSYADAMEALVNTYGERGDEEEIVDILTERDENEDDGEDDDSEEEEDDDSDEEESDESDEEEDEDGDDSDDEE